MHQLAKFLLLALISGEIDGAIGKKIPPHPEAETKWNKMAPRVLVGSGAADASLQAYGDSAANVTQAQIVEMGEAGYAKVELKLDVRQFLAQLETIPALAKAVTDMEAKLDSIRANQDQQVGFEKQILDLNKMLEDRLDSEESSIEALIKIVKKLEKHAETVNRELEHLGGGIENVGQAFAGGTGCDTSGLESSVDNISKSLPQIGDTMEKLIAEVNENLGTLRDNMQNSFAALERGLSLLDTISKPGYLCPEPTGLTKSEKQIMSSLTSFENKLRQIPEQLMTTLPQVFGTRNETLQNIYSLAQTGQQIRSDIDDVKQQLLKDKEAIRKFFIENQRSLKTVHKVVTETTQLVQSSAAAALSASRSSRCAPNKNKKPELDN